MHYHVLNNYDYITMYLAKVFFAMICQVWNRFMELEKIFKRLQKAGKVLADFSAAAHNELKLGEKNCNSKQSLVDNAPNYT